MNIALEMDFSAADAVMERALNYMEGTEIFSDCADVAIPEIRETARGGESFNGSAFAPYSDSYKKVRTKAGAQVDHVDLTRSGSLLDDLHLEGDMVLPAQSDIPRAIGLNRGNDHNKMPARPFMGLNEQAVGKLGEHITEKLQQHIRG